MNIFLWIIGVIVSYVILYFVIKIAVRNGIVEARYTNGRGDISDEDEGDDISKTTCPRCGKRHDIDYPKCPFCKYQS